MRTLTCFHCVHRGLTKGQSHCFCSLTKRLGKVERGYYCEKFERRESESYKEPIGEYLRRNLQIEDYRTAKQWEEAGRGIKDDAAGLRMYANGTSYRTYIYYLPEETYPISEN